MATITCFEELEIWKMARILCSDISRITNYALFSKDYRFRDQIRSSSGSVMDNIAEGFERSGNKEFIQFLYIAKGSCGEVRSQLYRALDVSYITTDEFVLLKEKVQQLSKKIATFIQYLHNTEMTGIKYKRSSPKPQI
ncbi:MAG: four helix bundle protein [Prevotellaceae bacterium]|jgi:four helix bundle protein|nr:four helix bundle protein [Prevotellaceae bacterium]